MSSAVTRCLHGLRARSFALNQVGSFCFYVYARGGSPQNKSPITNFSVTELFFIILNKVRDDMPAVAHRQNKSPITKFFVTELFFIYLTKVRGDLPVGAAPLHCYKDETDNKECCYNCNSDVLLCVFLCCESNECVSDSTDTDTI